MLRIEFLAAVSFSIWRLTVCFRRAKPSLREEDSLPLLEGRIYLAAT